ncbi:unnamed protein product [Caenorhabditis brenneri]
MLLLLPETLDMQLLFLCFHDSIMLLYKFLFALLVVIGLTTALPIGGGSGSGLSVPTDAELPELFQNINDTVM